MIIITGAAGFIGSNLAKKLNDVGRNDLILIDDINHQLKKDNIESIFLASGIKSYINQK